MPDWRVTNLDECGSSRNLSVEMFLSLFLLNFEGKPRTEDTLKE